MKAFTCTDFEGHYPVGTAAVIIADNAEDAEIAILKELGSIGLPQKHAIRITEISLLSAGVFILADGNY